MRNHNTCHFFAFVSKKLLTDAVSASKISKPLAFETVRLEVHFILNLNFDSIDSNVKFDTFWRYFAFSTFHSLFDFCSLTAL